MPALVGMVDAHDIAFWIYLGLVLMKKHPEDGKQATIDFTTEWFPEAEKDTSPETLEKVVSVTLQQGSAFLKHLAEEEKRAEALVAQAEADVIGKENMN
jgi:hypothetical protein